MCAYIYIERMNGPILQHFAYRVSQVFNPLFIVACIFLGILYDCLPSLNVFVVCLTVFVIFGILLPMGPVVYLYCKGVVPSLFVPERKKRVKLLLFALASCGIGLGLLVVLGAPRPVIAVMGCYVVQAFLMFVLTQRIKVSLHAAGVWGGWAMLGIYNGLTTFWILPLPVLVSWSRVVIQAHTPLQVFWGGAVGGGVTWLVFNYLLKG